ncbi:MAG TPA: hypothetical protein VHM02_09055, partial [Thermoanaerobaculia bacterium]|nr:hypothetical protein [Thermoanaerobaculia bacterium]
MSPSAVADGLELGEVVTDADGHRAELVVAPASPWLAGHFPGHPVLPAVAQLAVAERLHRAAEERGQLAGVDAMRFAAPVAPGDRLVARLTACDEDGRARWRLERADGGEVATGTLVWGSPSADAVADPPEPIPGVDDGAPAALPHAGAARL